MGGSRKPKVEVTEYRLSMHLGICVGPVDEIKAIYIDEKPMWQGSATSNTVLNIDRKSLFGGVKEEGGVSGQCHILMGGNGQTLPSWLASKLPGNHVPGFRGLCSLFFTGFPGSRPGFYWTANSPYIKDVWVKVRHVPGGLNAGYAEFPDGSVNPAHVIYEAMTRAELGMGEPSYKFDHDAWNAAAQTLWNENLGVAFAWTGQIPVEDIVKDMQDHIDGWVFQHPRTGLWTLKLVRGDYDKNTLPVIDPDVAILSNFQRKGLGETVNEIVVTYTNPGTEKEETVTVHDLGNIAAQGALVSDSRNYYGIRSPQIAAMLGQRDIRIASTPLCACEAVLNRKFWDLVPGDVVKLTWPDYGLNELVMRVGKVDYGLPGNQAIKVSLVEDIFASPAGSYVVPPVTEWEDPGRDPRPVAAPFSHVVTLPAYMNAVIFGQEIADMEPPEVRAGVLVTQNDSDTFYYGLASQLNGPSGQLEWRELGTRSTLGYGTLQSALSREAKTTGVNLTPLYGSTYPQVEGFVWIGQPEHFNEDSSSPYRRAELCLITGGDDYTGWEIRRGILDTQPLDWPAGTPFWLIDPDVEFDDADSERSVGEIARYRAMPVTSRGGITIDQANTFTGVLTNRPYRPYRPAYVLLNGRPWGEGLEIDPVNFPMTPLVFTWFDRNRLTETAMILSWDDGQVMPEDGTETVVDLYDRSEGASALPVITKTAVSPPIGLPATIEFTPLELRNVSRTSEITWSIYSRRDGLTSFSRISGHFNLKEPYPAIVYVRASQHVMEESSATISVNLPDLSDVSVTSAALFMIVMHRSPLTPPPGWVLVASEQNPPWGTTLNQRTSVYRRLPLSPSDSSATSEWSQEVGDRFIAQAVLFKNANPNEGIVVGSVEQNSTAGGPPFTIPSVTGTEYGQCALIVASAVSTAGLSGLHFPSSTNITRISPTSIRDNRLAVGRKYLDDGESLSGNFTGTGTSISAISLLLTTGDPVVPMGGYGLNYGEHYG